MNFGAPILLILLAATPLALAIGLWTLRWRARQAGRMIRLGGGEVLSTSDARSRLLWLTAIGLALAFLALAAARPQIGARETEVRQTGIAVAVALDVSLSMGAQDVDPSRLAVAQAEIGRLFERLRGDRVGLVIFGGDAFVRFPLTRDVRAAREIVDALRPGEVFVPTGTNISAAIDTARSLLEQSDAATRAILIVSDGESLRGDALIAAGEAAGAGVRVFSAGVGTAAGSTILVESGVRGFGPLTPQIDRNTGQPIITRADLAALQSLAQAGRGRFADLGRPGALSALADYFDVLESTTFAVTLQRSPIERFQIFAALALVLLALEPLAPGLRRGWRWLRGGRNQRVQAATLGLFALLIGLIAGACASSAFSRNEQGNVLYDEGDYAAALSEYRQAQADEPGDRQLNLNAGRALHELGEFERAASESGRATGSEDATLAARAFFNLGNHRVAAGDLLAARNAYIESLLLNSTDVDAKFNLELVNAALATQQPPAADQSSDQPGDGGPPNPGQEGSAPGEGDQDGAQPGQQDDSAPPAGEAADGDQPPGEREAQPSPGEDEPGGLGETPPDVDGDSGLSALEALQQALSELDDDAPTREQALAILDALRTRLPRDLLSAGQQAPVEIDPEDR